MSDRFPFDLSDVKAWIIRRKDGTVVKYRLVSPESLAKGTPKKQLPAAAYSAYSFREWCDHEPHPGKDLPIFSASGVSIWIADAPGARKCFSEFDVCIDGGNVLSVPGEHDLPNIYGDPSFKSKLSKHVHTYGYDHEDKPGPRIIKLRWADRCAPPVYPSFWPALTDMLLKMAVTLKRDVRVLTICQGGHGRSGTALVSLVMCLTDYTPLDGLTHIRALHCARAIESKEQHLYLNALAHELGREENALEAEEVPSFRERFLASTHPVMAAYQDRIGKGLGAKVTAREGKYL